MQITTTSLFAAGRSLEFSATLAGDPDQTVGMLLAHFNTKMNGTTLGLYARTVTAPIVETLIPGNWYAGPHLFRVDWNATNVVYWIDGIKVVTHNVIFPAAVKMTVIGSDWMRNDVGWLVIDWMRLTPYAASGTYTSKVFNSGFLATWMNASWTANAPAGTNVVVSYRTGNTAIPDGTWTAFTTVSSSGAALSGVSITLTTRERNLWPVCRPLWRRRYSRHVCPIRVPDSLIAATGRSRPRGLCQTVQLRDSTSHGSSVRTRATSVKLSLSSKTTSEFDRAARSATAESRWVR